MMIFPRQGAGQAGAPISVEALQAIGEADIAPMVARHAVMRHLCRELEDCANRLPDRYVISHAAVLSARLAANLRECEAMGRAVWSRMFGTQCEATDSALAQRMRHYHAADALHAEDLHEALARAAAQGPAAAAQTDLLGYMMRCLFDGCRRCIDCREAALLLLGADRMSAGAAAALRASLNTA